MPDSLQRIYTALLEGHMVEFRFHDTDYLIQQEQNKGWDYISIWQLSEPVACLSRTLFDIWDGISDESVTELLNDACIEGHSVAELCSGLQRLTIR